MTEIGFFVPVSGVETALMPHNSMLFILQFTILPNKMTVTNNFPPRSTGGIWKSQN